MAATARSFMSPPPNVPMRNSGNRRKTGMKKEHIPERIPGGPDE